MSDFTTEEVEVFEEILAAPQPEPLNENERYVAWLEFELLASREALKIVSREAYRRVSR